MPFLLGGEEGGEVGYYNELQGTFNVRKMSILSIYARAVQAII